MGAAWDGSEKRGSRGVCPKCFPGFWASGTFYAHLATGMDVLCIRGVLGRGGVGAVTIFMGAEKSQCIRNMRPSGPPELLSVVSLSLEMSGPRASLRGQWALVAQPAFLPTLVGPACLAV